MKSDKPSTDPRTIRPVGRPTMPCRAGAAHRTLLLLATPAVLTVLLSGCTHAFITPANLRQPGVKRPRCNPARTIRRLSRKPQEGLDIIQVAAAALTTPFKKMGLWGWRDTGCDATVVGVPVRDAQHSSGGFYTIDLRLVSFEVEGKVAGSGRFLRIEISPDTKAQEVASSTSITPASTLRLSGPVVIDEDGPFLEVHPGDDFHLVK